MFILKCDVCNKEIKPKVDELNCIRITVEDLMYTGRADVQSDMTCRYISKIVCQTCGNQIVDIINSQIQRKGC